MIYWSIALLNLHITEKFCYEFTQISMFFFIKFLLLQADLLYLHFLMLNSGFSGNPIWLKYIILCIYWENQFAKILWRFFSTCIHVGTGLNLIFLKYLHQVLIWLLCFPPKVNCELNVFLFFLFSLSFGREFKWLI